MSSIVIRPFNAVWWAVLLLIVLISPLPGRLHRGRPARDNRRFLVWFGLFTVAYLLVYRYLLYVTPDYDFVIWNELPLHACNMVALLAAPAVNMADTGLGRAVKGFCFFGGIVFAPLALMMPITGFEAPPLLSVNAICYYTFHGLILVLAVSFCTLGEYRPAYRDIPGVLGVFLALAVMAHILNMALRATVYPGADYFYTYGIDGNPIMDLLKSHIPVNFLFLLPLAPAFGAVFALVTFVTQRLEGRH